MSLNDYERWLARDEAADRTRERRQQAELFDPAEFAHTTPEEREIQVYYAHQSRRCTCGHDLGMHDYLPERDCKVYGCKWREFQQMPPSKPVASEAKPAEEAA